MADLGEASTAAAMTGSFSGFSESSMKAWQRNVEAQIGAANDGIQLILERMALVSTDNGTGSLDRLATGAFGGGGSALSGAISNAAEGRPARRKASFSGGGVCFMEDTPQLDSLSV